MEGRVGGLGDVEDEKWPVVDDNEPRLATATARDGGGVAGAGNPQEMTRSGRSEGWAAPCRNDDGPTRGRRDPLAWYLRANVYNESQAALSGGGMEWRRVQSGEAHDCFQLKLKQWVGGEEPVEVAGVLAADDEVAKDGLGWGLVSGAEEDEDVVDGEDFEEGSIIKEGVRANDEG